MYKLPGKDIDPLSSESEVLFRLLMGRSGIAVSVLSSGGKAAALMPSVPQYTIYTYICTVFFSFLCMYIHIYIYF